MTFDPSKPYNDLPDLPPAYDIETKAALKKAISANRALAELKGLGMTLPDQSILINSIILQEARVSSEIEQIITTNDALYRAMAMPSDTNIDPATKEVIRYREALWTGFNNLTKRGILTTNDFIQIANTIKMNDSGIRKIAGTVLNNPVSGEVIYTPPDGEDIIRQKLSNLENYIHAEDNVDPLLKMAVMHYQFEAIHPFHDGNGRMERILNILYLVQQKLLAEPVLYLSRYIIDNKTEYYKALRTVTEKHEWESWILFMLDAVEQTAVTTKQRIQGIKMLFDETTDFIKNVLPEIYSRELVELFFKNPYVKVQHLVDAGIAKRQTAATYLRKLEDIGIFKPMKVGRENIFINIRLFELLSK
ncbi:MAG: Fic family protein [Armatimonadota bacterium]